MTPQDKATAQRALRHLALRIELVSDLIHFYPETEVTEVLEVLQGVFEKAQHSLGSITPAAPSAPPRSVWTDPRLGQ
jgi:hypothetical protein